MVRFWLSIFWRAAASIRASCEQIFEHLADFQSNGVSVFDEVHLVQVRERVGNDMSQFVDLVAAQSHRTALYFRTSSFFTLRNIS